MSRSKWKLPVVKYNSVRSFSLCLHSLDSLIDNVSLFLLPHMYSLVNQFVVINGCNG